MLAAKYPYNYSWFPSNEHLTSVDNVQQFVIVVQKCVCIIFCRVISQQLGGSSDSWNKCFVVSILHCHQFNGATENENFDSTCIILNNVYKKF